MHRFFKLHGNAFKSLKSCNCMALEKSSVINFKFGHLLASSWRTGGVTRSHGSSRYLSVDPNLTLISATRPSVLLMCSPEYSGRSETTCHKWLSYANILHFLLTLATQPSSLCFKKEKIFKRSLSGTLVIFRLWKKEQVNFIWVLPYLSKRRRRMRRKGRRKRKGLYSW